MFLYGVQQGPSHSAGMLNSGLPLFDGRRAGTQICSKNALTELILAPDLLDVLGFDLRLRQARSIEMTHRHLINGPHLVQASRGAVDGFERAAFWRRFPGNMSADLGVANGSNSGGRHGSNISGMRGHHAAARFR